MGRRWSGDIGIAAIMAICTRLCNIAVVDRVVLVGAVGAEKSKAGAMAVATVLVGWPMACRFTGGYDASVAGTANGTHFAVVITAVGQ